MHIQKYNATDLHFAYTCHVYLRWHTHRSRPQPFLAQMDKNALAEIAQPYDIKILECTADDKHLLTLVSLRPHETVSVCASKLKGGVSKWLREPLNADENVKLLGKGYFACTSGKSTNEAIRPYIEKQGTHHGYANRVVPPVYTYTARSNEENESHLNPKHACAVLQFHLVFATTGRHGVFGSESGPVISDHWQSLGKNMKFALLKASFVPDHVHVAVRSHPSVAPVELAAELMNAAEEVMCREFREHLIQAGIDRLWQASAYIGSFGDISSSKIRNYVKKWERSS
jgi:REP element-mobilizing transposase RayT